MKKEPKQQAEAYATVTPKPEAVPVVTVTIADPIVEKAIREELEKPTGELTKADLEKVTQLHLYLTPITKITDASLKEVAKLQQLKALVLTGNQITAAGVAELQKALPKCKIISNPKK